MGHGETVNAMKGLVMDAPLCVPRIVRRARDVFADQEIVSAGQSEIERRSFGEVVERAMKLAGALQDLGVRPGDRVATFAWNSMRHLELYMAVPTIGAVLHTLNIRLFEEELRYIVGDAGAKLVFLESSLAETMPRFETIEHEILMPDGPGAREGALAYEDLIASGNPIDPADIDEQEAATLCYTSGTTGRPKGVLTSHRSTFLHAMCICQPDAVGLRNADTVMPVVPMFHAAAWGYPYGALLSGSRLVLPGPRTAPLQLCQLIEQEKVNKSSGVPVVWQGVLELPDPPDISSLDEVLVGGSAMQLHLKHDFEARFGVKLLHGWGMTETGPVGTVSRLPGEISVDGEGQLEYEASQGRPLMLTEFRIDPEAGNELLARGSHVASEYYGAEKGEDRFTDDGWLRTGDVAEFLPGRYLKIVDRAKDLIKSGGEWISSVELENAIMAHPDVIEAAVVGVADVRWDERPLAYIVTRNGAPLDYEELRAHLLKRVAKWWIPERVEYLSEIPKTSVGKLDKKALRERLQGNRDKAPKEEANV